MIDQKANGGSVSAENQLDLLAVDDEQDMGELLQLIGNELGLSVLSVTNGTAFKDSFIRHNPRAVVLDLVMPDIDGIELLQWIIRKGHSPIVGFMSGYNEAYMQSAKIIAELSKIELLGCLQKPAALGDIEHFLTPLAEK